MKMRGRAHKICNWLKPGSHPGPSARGTRKNRTRIAYNILEDCEEKMACIMLVTAVHPAGVGICATFTSSYLIMHLPQLAADVDAGDGMLLTLLWRAPSHAEEPSIPDHAHPILACIRRPCWGAFGLSPLPWLKIYMKGTVARGRDNEKGIFS
jgi:hypothetical protein